MVLSNALSSFQLALVLFDTAVAELFPEIYEDKDSSSNISTTSST